MQIDKKNLLLKQLPSMRQMLAFVTVYEFQHMSAAAEQLSLTQPAVTVLIKELEQKLGVKLFDRSSRNLKPTEAAEKVMPYMLRALAELNELKHHMDDYIHLNQGSFQLAITPNSAQSLLSDLISSFVEKYPNIKINVLECEPLELLPTLLKEKVDLCLGTLEKKLPFIDQHMIMQDHIVAIHHPDYVLQQPIQTWQDLTHERLILTKRGYGIRQHIETHLHSLNTKENLEIAYETSLMSTVVSLVKSRLGVGLVPYSTVKNQQENICICELHQPELKREISLFHLKEKSLNPSAQAFLDLCLAEKF